MLEVTGETYRYHVDRIDVPRTSEQAASLAADLDGNGTRDNKFGNATAVLATTNDLSPHGPDMLAAGRIAPVLEILADDLENDDLVAVTLWGGVPMTGPIRDGVFTTTTSGGVDAVIPVFVNADPTVMSIGAQIELRFDDAGGIEAILRGTVEEHEARTAAHAGLVQMIETEPERHLVFARSLDEDRDDVISLAEAEASVIGVLVSADIGDYVSFAVGLHAAPTPVAAAPQMSCRDRVVDGDETDVDCGGSCQRCWSGKSCTRAEDCQSNSCVGGTCAAATCTDGVRDGLESDIDCGGTCPACTTGQACAADRDCASGSCSNTAALGSCS